MGSQHNTHIYNNCGEIIKILLTDSNNRNTSRILEDEQLTCIPTIEGSNTISVFRKQDDDSFQQTPDAVYTDKSDISFIIIKENNFVQIVRSKYGFKDIPFLFYLNNNF